MRDLHSLAAPSTPAYPARRRDARGETTQQREHNGKERYGELKKAYLGGSLRASGRILFPEH